MHQLRERLGDLLQRASEFDESTNFEQLSDIVEYTDDAVREAWLEAKHFVSSCEEKLRYRLNDTFLANVFTSVLSTLPPIKHVVHAPSPCVERIRYRMNDTCLADIFTSEPSPLSLAEHVVQSPTTEGESELAVQQHTPTVSRVNTMAICAAVAHHVTPCRETSTFEATLGRYNQASDNNKTTLPLLALSKRDTPQFTTQAVFTVEP